MLLYRLCRPNNSYVLLNEEVEEIDDNTTSLGRKFEIINNTGDNYRTISRKSRTDLYESMLERLMKMSLTHIEQNGMHSL